MICGHRELRTKIVWGGLKIKDKFWISSKNVIFSPIWLKVFSKSIPAIWPTSLSSNVITISSHSLEPSNGNRSAWSDFSFRWSNGAPFFSSVCFLSITIPFSWNQSSNNEKENESHNEMNIDILVTKVGPALSFVQYNSVNTNRSINKFKFHCRWHVFIWRPSKKSSDMNLAKLVYTHLTLDGIEIGRNWTTKVFALGGSQIEREWLLHYRLWW